jgi:hypothetical protein
MPLESADGRGPARRWRVIASRLAVVEEITRLLLDGNKTHVGVYFSQ